MPEPDGFTWDSGSQVKLFVHHGGSIGLAEHISRLCASVKKAKNLGRRGVELLVETEPVRCDPETVTTFGLAVNKLISKTFEHAFPGGRQGQSTVRLRAGSGAFGAAPR